MLYGLDDITLIPAKITDIDSRAECDPFYHDYNDKGIFGKHLPLLAAPMSSVIDENNFNKFTNCGINAVVPRSVDVEKKDFFVQAHILRIRLGRNQNIFH